MKLALIGFACLMVAAMSVQGAPQAGPPPISEDNLAPQCLTPPCPSGNANLRYPLDCLQYVECKAGVSKIRACPPDQQFSENAGTCVDSKIANCLPCWQQPPASSV